MMDNIVNILIQPYLIFKKLLLRFYEIFPKKWGPLGLGAYVVTLGMNIFLFSIHLVAFFPDYEVYVPLVTFGGMGISSILVGFFLFFRDYEILLKIEQEKGKAYNRKWKIITWVYLILSWSVPWIII